MECDAEAETLGYYEPGFIHLRVNTTEELNDLNRLGGNAATARWVSTFFHEYIHFLQDVSTTHGLVNFILAVEYLKNANKQVLESQQAEFKIPLKITNAFNSQTNDALKRVYYGDSQTSAESVTYREYFAENQSVTTGAGKVITVPQYKVRYYDNGAQTSMVCRFGSRHLKEYMAHAIQNRFAPGTSHFDIPYVLAELIVRKEYPRLAEDTSLVVALCDAALMHYHPAQLFFHTLKSMQDARWVPGDVDSVYAFAFDGVTLSGDNQTETPDSLYKKTAGSAVGQFADCLKADIFKDNVRWFETVVQEAVALRGEHRGFITRLVEAPGKFSALFYQIFNRLGIPFMTNLESKGYFRPPEKLKALSIYPYYPKVFQAIGATYRGRRECVLHPFCEARTDRKVTNEHCLTGPWERVGLPELCPYAQIWKTWGLAGKRPSAP